MSSSLVKFMDRSGGNGDGRRLYWNRADVDGAPFRGQLPPMMPEEELDNRLVKVCDPKNRIFDLQDAKANQDYLATLDKVYNRWAALTFVKRSVFRSKKTGKIRVQVYMEWVEFYMEDGQPLHAQRPYFGRPNE